MSLCTQSPGRTPREVRQLMSELTREDLSGKEVDLRGVKYYKKKMDLPPLAVTTVGDVLDEEEAVEVIVFCRDT